MVGLIFPVVYHRAVDAAQSASRSIDKDARAYAYQDDLDIVELPTAVATTRAAYATACLAIGLRSNASKETVACGGRTPLAAAPLGIKLVERPVVLRHGAQISIPVLPAISAISGSQLAAQLNKS